MDEGQTGLRRIILMADIHDPYAGSLRITGFETYLRIGPAQVRNDQVTLPDLLERVPGMPGELRCRRRYNRCISVLIQLRDDRIAQGFRGGRCARHGKEDRPSGLALG